MAAPGDMRCGDPAQAGLLGATGGGRFCPRCESQIHQEYRVRPDQEPTSHRRRCHDCGWDSGWVDYQDWIVLRGGPMITAVSPDIDVDRLVEYIETGELKIRHDFAEIDPRGQWRQVGPTRTQTVEEIAEEAGRRTVHKYGEALRRLGEEEGTSGPGWPD